MAKNFSSKKKRKENKGHFKKMKKKKKQIGGWGLDRNLFHTEV